MPVHARLDGSWSGDRNGNGGRAYDNEVRLWMDTPDVLDRFLLEFESRTLWISEMDNTCLRCFELSIDFISFNLFFKLFVKNNARETVSSFIYSFLVEKYEIKITFLFLKFQKQDSFHIYIIFPVIYVYSRSSINLIKCS